MRTISTFILALGIGAACASAQAAPITIEFTTASLTQRHLNTGATTRLRGLDGSITFDLLAAARSWGPGDYRSNTGCQGVYAPRLAPRACTGSVAEDSPFISHFGFDYGLGPETLPAPSPAVWTRNEASVGNGKFTILAVADAAFETPDGAIRSYYSFKLELESSGFTSDWTGDTLPAITKGTFIFEDYAERLGVHGPRLPNTDAFPYDISGTIATVNGAAVGATPPVGVPEPASSLLVLAGLLAAGTAARRRTLQ